MYCIDNRLAILHEKIKYMNYENGIWEDIIVKVYGTNNYFVYEKRGSITKKTWRLFLDGIWN